MNNQNFSDSHPQGSVQSRRQHEKDIAFPHFILRYFGIGFVLIRDAKQKVCACIVELGKINQQFQWHFSGMGFIARIGLLGNTKFFAISACDSCCSSRSSLNLNRNSAIF